MQLRTFLAKDMKAALSAMRAELGDEAIIVATEKMKDGTMLLRAGLERTQTAPVASEDDMPSSAPDPALVSGALGSFDTRYREALVMRLRVPKTDGPSDAHRLDREELVAALRAHSTPDNLS